MSGLFGSKPKDYVLRPGEVNDIAIQDWQRNNPNVYNPFGSTEVTFDGNQATVNQQFSPELQGLFGQHMGFLSQGPQQLGNTSNPFLEGAIGNSMSSVFGRTGQGMPQKPMQGGQVPNPGLSFGYDQGLPTVGPPSPQQPSMGERIGQGIQMAASAQPGSVEQQPGGGYGGYSQGDGLGPLLEALQQQRRQNRFNSYG